MKIGTGTMLRGVLRFLAVVTVLGGVSASDAVELKVCPAAGGGPQDPRAYANQGTVDCWTGQTWATGKTFARAEVTTWMNQPLHYFGSNICAYKFGNLDNVMPSQDYAYARALGFSSGGSPLGASCNAYDYTADGNWTCDYEFSPMNPCIDGGLSYAKLSAWVGAY